MCVMLQMYANRNYAGEDLLLINSVTITSSVGYWIFMIIFIVMVCCGMGWSVWHPNMIKSSQYRGITGIALFALVNTLPFSDLWAVTRGYRTHFTLLMPMMINTFLGCLENALWALHICFGIANSVAAGLAFVQVLWLLVLRIVHREVVGQITDFESLRSVFLSVSKSLERLAAAPPAAAFWTRVYLLELQGSLDIGWQSLSLMERTFTRLEAELVKKADLLAAAAIEAGGNEASVANQVASSNAVAAEASANASLALCRSFLGTCRSNMIAFDDMKRAIKDRLSNNDPQAQNLQASITVASTTTRGLADNLRSSIQIINASEGIPSTIKIAFNFCHEQILSVKTCADSKLQWLGCGAFSFRRRLGFLQEDRLCAQ
uniref:Uncharacterized protein n=1 Tax=Setaria italica TaxID=4555 RepID=K3XQ38_SETIT